MSRKPGNALPARAAGVRILALAGILGLAGAGGCGNNQHTDGQHTDRQRIHEKPAREFGARTPETGRAGRIGACRRWGYRWRAPRSGKRLHVLYAAGEGGSVQLALRQAGTPAELGDATFETVAVLPGGELPMDLTLPKGGVVEAELRLLSAHHLGAPRVYRVGLEWQCPGPQSPGRGGCRCASRAQVSSGRCASDLESAARGHLRQV